MYKDLIKLIAAMIIIPGKTWQSLAAKTERNDDYLSRIVYPLIGLVALSAFAGVFFTQRHFDWEIALKAAIKALVSSFGAFFLSAYLINELWRSLFKQSSNLLLCRRFTGYASIIMYSLNIILNLLPTTDFFFLRIFHLYTIYIIWEGTKPYMKITDEQIHGIPSPLILTAIAGITIITLPAIIGSLLYLLMPGLRN